MLSIKPIFAIMCLLFIAGSASAGLVDMSRDQCIENQDNCSNDGQYPSNKFNSSWKDTASANVKFDPNSIIRKQAGEGDYHWQDAPRDNKSIIEEVTLVDGADNSAQASSSKDQTPFREVKYILEVQANSELLTDRAEESLIKFVKSAPSQSDFEVLIEGYTASDKNTQVNIDLSYKRALLVKKLLIEHGIPAERIVATGRGIENPVATNDTSEGRRKNRRVEVSIVPK